MKEITQKLQEGMKSAYYHGKGLLSGVLNGIPRGIYTPFAIQTGFRDMMRFQDREEETVYDSEAQMSAGCLKSQVMIFSAAVTTALTQGPLFMMAVLNGKGTKYLTALALTNIIDSGIHYVSKKIKEKRENSAA